MTHLQKLVSKTMNCYPDHMFIDMVQCLDSPIFWENIVVEELTDEECLEVLERLVDMFYDFNYA